jgi:hypothetical protein
MFLTLPYGYYLLTKSFANVAGLFEWCTQGREWENRKFRDGSDKGVGTNDVLRGRCGCGDLTVVAF